MSSSSALPHSILQDRRLYEVLCLANFSSGEEVRVAYKALALKNHPDKNIGDPSAADRFRVISRAYEVLSNPEHKKKYDVALAGYVGTPGHLGSNPYSVSPMSMADVFRDVYARQAERAAARSRTSSAPAKDAQATATASQYTKAQQELFRKRERERQQELRRQLEKERKEQRDRERAALRREQERQEELLQQRWQQQQQKQQQQQRGLAPRMSTRTGATKRTSSTGTGGAGSARRAPNISGRGPEGGGSRSVTPRPSHATPRAHTSTTTTTTTSAPAATTPSKNDDRWSGRGVQAAPSTVRVSTPVRNVTPRMRRAGGATTSSPGRRSTDRASSTPPTTPTPTSLGKDEEDDEDGALRKARRDAPTTNPKWYTPLTGLMEGSVRVPRTSTFSSSNSSSSSSSSGRISVDGEDGDGGAPSHTPQPHPSMGFTAAATEPGTASGTAEPSRLYRPLHRPTVAAASMTFSAADSARTTHHCGNSNDHHQQYTSSAGTAKEDCADAREGSIPGNAARSQPSSTASTAPSRMAARTSSPRSSPTTTATSTRTTGATPNTPRRGPTSYGRSTTATTTTGNGRATSPAVRTPRTPGARSPQPGHRAAPSTPLSSSSPASTAAVHRVRVTPGLADADRELLEKQRRERMAKEKERQRAVRLAEEERQFRRAARAMKQQREANSAAEAEATRLTQEELLAYVHTDEASERQQFIEREEQLAWRRLQRQHITVLAEAVFRKKFAALAMEELMRRSDISSAARLATARLSLTFQEWAERCGVEWREGRDRRQLKGREAADSYHAQRRARARVALYAEESTQRRVCADRAWRAFAVLHALEAEAENRTCVVAEEGAARSTMCASLVEQRRRLAPQCALRTSEGDGRGTDGHSFTEEETNDGDDQHLSPAAFRGTDHNASSFAAVAPTLPPPPSGAVIAAVVPLSTDGSYPQTGLAGSFQTARSHSTSSSSSSSSPTPTTTPSSSSSPISDVVESERRPVVAAQAVERRMHRLLADEARQRGVLVTQQHHEEMALRRRRATALHRCFGKEKEEAVRQAVRRAQAELRLAQQHNRGASASPQDESCDSAGQSPQRGGASAGRIAAAMAAPTKVEVVTRSASLSLSASSPLMDARSRAPSLSAPAGMGGAGSSTTAAVAVSCRPAAALRRHVVSAPGWQTVQHSDAEDEEEQLATR